ncbi:MAG: hypothetical protein Sylvanvirus34_11 [Sylvanvirus sp.]|uniref:MORN repeat-containing protein n=1 Tax=Sylvanvirus sp. TaxID=2487774 RepID=A0A3G5AJ08_9VIRU|nr:MAG: hypothetical protein Sylvanvirus34_11 [Sylvanvirus sp.]
MSSHLSQLSRLTQLTQLIQLYSEHNKANNDMIADLLKTIEAIKMMTIENVPNKEDWIQVDSADNKKTKVETKDNNNTPLKNELNELADGLTDGLTSGLTDGLSNDISQIESEVKNEETFVNPKNSKNSLAVDKNESGANVNHVNHLNRVYHDHVFEKAFKGGLFTGGVYFLEEDKHSGFVPHGRGNYCKRTGNVVRDIYEGEWEHGLYHGRGTLYYPRFGFKCFKGEFINGNEGKGQWIFQDGKILETTDLGQCERSTDNRLIFPNGDIFTGAVDNFHSMVEGCLMYENGDTYKGAFSEEKRHGKGTLVANLHGIRHKSITSATYSGTFENDEFMNGSKEYSNGETYIANKFVKNAFTKNEWSAIGQCTYKHEDITIEGYVEKGRFNNECKITSEKGTYHGNLCNDKPNGEGTMKYSNGNMYKGTWKDGNRHGLGTMTYVSERDFCKKEVEKEVVGRWVNGTTTVYERIIGHVNNAYDAIIELECSDTWRIVNNDKL